MKPARRSFFPGLASRATAEFLAQKSKGINAGIVAVAPTKTKPIPPDRFDILNRNQHGDVRRLDPKFSGPFIRAGRAWTMLTQISHRIDTFVPVAPFDA